MLGLSRLSFNFEFRSDFLQQSFLLVNESLLLLYVVDLLLSLLTQQLDLLVGKLDLRSQTVKLCLVSTSTFATFEIGESVCSV